jgi:diguanylate cyclase (GGDEF)-like protein
MLLILGATATFAGADTVYLFQVAKDSYVEGGLLDLFWPLALVMVGLAAWQPATSSRAARLEGWRVLMLPGGVAAGALALLVVDRSAARGQVAACLAATALAVCLVRAGLTFRENIALAHSHHRQAITDPLTGLPNRRHFLERAEQAILQARRDRGRVAVMVIDLDRFKEVNDTLGHLAGDGLLQEIARRLRSSMRESDTVARLGGDEFAVILSGVVDAAAAEAVGLGLVEVISRPVAVGDLSLDVDASIGVALFPDHADGVESLLQHADVAMYAAKSQNLGTALYAPEHDQSSPDRLALIGELRRAIERDELVLHYQPKVELASDTVVGVEALVRWQHPSRGLLPPAEFVPPPSTRP